ncbi:MAG TPA: hypothetical protein PK156_50225 [Polyangium sp.]|nr:hypothetical protein [Polyangium sp.]
MSTDFTYQVGIAHKDITPTQAEFDSESLFLWGFGFRSSTAYVTSTRTPTDRLRATALAISTATETVIFLALDVGALSESMTAQIRTALTTNHGIPAEHVCVNVSHTHAAPTVVSMASWQPGVATAYESYVNRIVGQAIDCVADALQARQTARLYFARGSTQVGGPRNNGAAGYDPTLDVIVAKSSTNTTIATVFSVACHPVLVGDNFVSADYPGVTRALIEQTHGGVAMFLQGFAGQTNPRVTGVDLVGQLLFNDVDGVLRGTLVQLSGSLMGRHVTTQLPLGELPSDWEAILPGGDLTARWKSVIEARIADGTDATLNTEVQTIRIGQGADQLRVLASGHEVTCDLGVALRDILPVERTTTLAYCNVQCCYIGSKTVLETNDVRSQWPNVNMSQYENYEGGQSFFWYGRRAPLTNDAIDQYLNAFRSVVDDPWAFVGSAPAVTAMAASSDTLFAATSTGRLFTRSTAAGTTSWEDNGAAENIVGLAVFGGNLFACNGAGRLLTRPVSNANAAWTDIGSAESVQAMTTHRGQIYVLTGLGTVWVRAAMTSEIVWSSAGTAPALVGLTSVRGMLIGATAQNELLWRQPSGNWMRFGRVESVVGLAAIGSMLYAVTSSGHLWQREI